jgi:hypothetical protein
VARICMDVGLASVGSFTSSFRRVYGSTPTGYRESFPPAAQMAHIPTCILMAASRPAGGRMRAPVPLPAIESSFEEDGARVAT